MGEGPTGTLGPEAGPLVRRGGRDRRFERHHQRRFTRRTTPELAPFFSGEFEVLSTGAGVGDDDVVHGPGLIYFC